MADLIRYVTRYDGSEESIRRIGTMLRMFFWDDCKLRIDEFSNALIIETLDERYTIPKGRDFAITQDGEILRSVG